MAEALASGDHRPAAQILRDALTAADVLMLDAKVRAIEAGEPIPIARLDELVAAVARAAALARVASDAGIDERLRALRDADVADLKRILDLVFELWPAFPGDRSRDAHGPAFRRLVRQAIEHVTHGGPRPEVPVLPPRSPYRPAIEARQPVVRPAAAPPPSAAADQRSPNGRQRPLQRAGGAVEDAELVEPPQPPLRAVASVTAALPQFPRCPGCDQLVTDQAAHDQGCGWSLAAGRRPW